MSILLDTNGCGKPEFRAPNADPSSSSPRSVSSEQTPCNIVNQAIRGQRGSLSFFLKTDDVNIEERKTLFSHQEAAAKSERGGAFFAASTFFNAFFFSSASRFFIVGQFFV
ncbi:hypothetical protein HPP92_025018 [Vanilla planifolia]|uniref:Uncharacterized protein n=1 Tax=Vanilla planifolia TaxID=51239 RepID=A0A835PIA7_VANPL|nr:hypothetical protein HPP92_025018 [Vanilla planifolia]